MAAESALASFLDSCLYERITKERKVGFTRSTSLKEQLDGCDVAAEYRGKLWKIDEKAQIRHMKNLLPSFVLELSFLGAEKDGVRPVREGWFLKDGLETTHYAFIWPSVHNTSVCGNLDSIRPDDYSSAEYLLVMKARIKEFLDSKGWTTERLSSRAEEIRAQGCVGRISSDCPEFWFYHTDYLAESPINLVVQKNTLIRLARSRYIVTEQGPLAASLNAA